MGNVAFGGSSKVNLILSFELILLGDETMVPICFLLEKVGWMGSFWFPLAGC